MEQKLKNIKDRIVCSIEERKLAMKPRWHFVCYALLRVLVAMIVFASVVYLASFISLVMREHQLFEMFGLRPRGIWNFMMGLPWLLVMLSLALLIVLEVMARKFAFVYKRPAAYSLFILVLLVLGAGFVVHQVDSEFRFARVGECPNVMILGPIHKYYRGDIDDRPLVRGMHMMPVPTFDELRRDELGHPMMPQAILVSPCR